MIVFRIDKNWLDFFLSATVSYPFILFRSVVIVMKCKEMEWMCMCHVTESVSFCFWLYAWHFFFYGFERLKNCSQNSNDESPINSNWCVNLIGLMVISFMFISLLISLQFFIGFCTHEYMWIFVCATQLIRTQKWPFARIESEPKYSSTEMRLLWSLRVFEHNVCVCVSVLIFWPQKVRFILCWAFYNLIVTFFRREGYDQVAFGMFFEVPIIGNVSVQTSIPIIYPKKCVVHFDERMPNKFSHIYTFDIIFCFYLNRCFCVIENRKGEWAKEWTQATVRTRKKWNWWKRCYAQRGQTE